MVSIAVTTIIRKGRGGEDLRRLEEHLTILRESFGVRRIGIFGSVARGEETPASDIDILVEFARGRATFQNFMSLIAYLEDLFGRKVDVVTTGGIDPYLRPYTLREVIWCEA
ncbi:MAG TPA: nucleotidyltransferase [Methanoculleus sp.]|nr:nucleotidyltransferase [Methanoculleus sp.]